MSLGFKKVYVGKYVPSGRRNTGRRRKRWTDQHTQTRKPVTAHTLLIIINIIVVICLCTTQSVNL